jgi:Ca-activated chloride channel family protein
MLGFNAGIELDEPSLRIIADTTGGEYFRARNSEELQAIEATLDRLEPVAQKPTLARPTLPLYPWSLGLALLLSLLMVSQTLWPTLRQRWRIRLTLPRGKP